MTVTVHRNQIVPLTLRPRQPDVIHKTQPFCNSRKTSHPVSNSPGSKPILADSGNA